MQKTCNPGGETAVWPIKTPHWQLFLQMLTHYSPKLFSNSVATPINNLKPTNIIADQIYPFMVTEHPDGGELFHQDNAPSLASKIVQQ